jgi:hypothetical protein
MRGTHGLLLLVAAARAFVPAGRFGVQQHHHQVCWKLRQSAVADAPSAAATSATISTIRYVQRCMRIPEW